jgi:hypothetical protein
MCNERLHVLKPCRPEFHARGAFAAAAFSVADE